MIFLDTWIIQSNVLYGTLQIYWREAAIGERVLCRPIIDMGIWLQLDSDLRKST